VSGEELASHEIVRGYFLEASAQVAAVAISTVTL